MNNDNITTISLLNTNLVITAQAGNITNTFNQTTACHALIASILKGTTRCFFDSESPEITFQVNDSLAKDIGQSIQIYNPQIWFEISQGEGGIKQ